MIPISFETLGLSVNGFLGKPVIARGNRGFENYFINGRYVRSSLIAKAIEAAYKPFMMQHRYPFTVLYLTMDSDRVDVNVHPAKLELRFQDEAALYDTLTNGLGTALEGKEFIPQVELIRETAQEKPVLKAPEPFEKNRLETMRQRQEAQKSPASAKDPSPAPWQKREEGKVKIPFPPSTKAAVSEKPSGETVEADGQMTLFQEKLLSEKARSRHKLIGQLFDTYWLIQFEDKLFIMDQHAAHEKVLYEHTMKGLREHKFHSQLVSPPLIISLSKREEDILNRYRASFEKLGYEIESFGGREYAVSAVPANIFGIPQQDMLVELFAQLGEDLENEPSELIMEKIAGISCKAAVKGNHAMSFQEADALIDQLMTLDNPYACPHGRPTIISMSKYEIEKNLNELCLRRERFETAACYFNRTNGSGKDCAVRGAGKGHRR